MEGDVVSVERVIPAGPAAIFAVVADASRHPEIDGSGTVRQLKPEAPHLLGLGSTFGMSMKMGVGYSMESTVIEFEEGRRIAWQSRPPGFVGKFVAGRICQDHQRALLRLGALPTKTAENMTKTLERIDRIVTAT
jgi:uncharacterized protein YndB with AHSA1/START domain